MACLEVFDLPSLNRALAALQATPRWTVAAVDYELGYVLEPRAAVGWSEAKPARPLARFWQFERCDLLSPAETEAWLHDRLAELPAEARQAGIGGLADGLDEAAYRAAVGRIQDYIRAGDCYQVNFTFPRAFSWFGQPLALYAKLRERQPVRHGGFLESDAGAVVSLSPELFLERRGDRLETRPMKGTAPRSETPASLAACPKNRAENLMIVDLLRNDLGRLARPGSVRVDGLFEVEGYPTLWQMVSRVSAEVPGAGLAEILGALFPCGSITGAPKIRAMQIVGELEPVPRGLYTGAFGWLAPTGDFSLNVAIRTLELAPDGSGRMGVGSGIVADSDAAAEWRECHLKSEFLSRLDPGLRLIETLRREEGGYPRLAGHLARLRRSAAWFGFPLDESAVAEALAGLPETGRRRVRLTLGAAGDITAEAFPLADEPAGERLARWASATIRSDDPLRRHKTTVRAAYDAALKSIADEPRVFDLVFLNERGEVAEGARSNVFVERNGVLLTPPESSGALPGVLRAELLAAGLAQEAVLQPGDLAQGFWLGNALRGLVPARLAD